MAFDYQRQSSAQPGVEAPKSPSAFLIQCRIPLIRAEGLAGLIHDKLTARVFPDDAFEAPKLRLSTFLFDFLEGTGISIVTARAYHSGPPHNIHSGAGGIKDRTEFVMIAIHHAVVANKPEISVNLPKNIQDAHHSSLSLPQNALI